MSEHLPVQIT